MPDLLDTNFLSELRKPRPEPFVVAYFLSRPAEGIPDLVSFNTWEPLI